MRLETRDLSIGYRAGGKPRVLGAELALTLSAGELTCLAGPNGAGKSTLLRTLAGLQPPLAGDVLLDGTPLRRLDPRERARRIAVVLTTPVDVDYMTARELVALGRHPFTSVSGRLGATDAGVVAWALHTAGADALADRPLHGLSDGERQKVMIARGLAQEPALLLLDEPTAYLDLTHRAEVMRLLRQLAREGVRGRPLAVLLSTHDLDLGLRAADRVWLMQKGRALETGTPAELLARGAFQATFGPAFDDLVRG